MRYIIVYFFALCLIYCHGRTPAVQDAIREQEKALSALRPGTIAVSSNGYQMTALINGKRWTATSMMPPEASSRIIGYISDEYIGLPYDIRDLQPGKNNTLGPENAIDINFTDYDGLWFTDKGNLQATKNDGHWIEGKFDAILHEKASGRSVAVTEGFFRIPAGGGQKVAVNQVRPLFSNKF